MSSEAAPSVQPGQSIVDMLVGLASAYMAGSEPTDARREIRDVIETWIHPDQVLSLAGPVRPTEAEGRTP
jgi:hypothetical protein